MFAILSTPWQPSTHAEPVRVDPEILDARRARRRARVIKRLLTVVERLLEDEQSYLELKVERIIERGRDGPLDLLQLFR